VEGDRITVRRNTVSGSVRREASDADGMRFFGTAVRITGKYGNPGVPAGVRSITFTGNYCAVGGSQAVNLDGYPHVVIRGNTITGPNLYRGIYLSSGATDAAVDDNVLIGERPVYEADEESEPVAAAGNRNQR
jgi:hypothetical protein